MLKIPKKIANAVSDLLSLRTFRKMHSDRCISFANVEEEIGPLFLARGKDEFSLTTVHNFLRKGDKQNSLKTFSGYLMVIFYAEKTIKYTLSFEA